MSCPACYQKIEDLEEENRHLRRQLCLSTDERDVALLTEAFQRKFTEARPAVARVVSYLHAAKGRPVHWLALLDVIPARYIRSGAVDRQDNLVRVWICCARKYLGKDAIKTVHGIGYRITDIGAARVAEILGR